MSDSYKRRKIGGEVIVPANEIFAGVSGRQLLQRMVDKTKDKDAYDRKLAFARAAIREGMADNTALDFHDGDIDAAAKTLGIDLDAEVESLKEERFNQRVNDAMDQADAADDGEFYDLDIVVGPHMTRIN